MESMLTIFGYFIPITNTYQDEPSKGCVSSHSLSLKLVEREPFQKHIHGIHQHCFNIFTTHVHKLYVVILVITTKVTHRTCS